MKVEEDVFIYGSYTHKVAFRLRCGSRLEARGSWLVARGLRLAVHMQLAAQRGSRLICGSRLAARGSRLAARGSRLVARGSWLAAHGSEYRGFMRLVARGSEYRGFMRLVAMAQNIGDSCGLAARGSE